MNSLALVNGHVVTFDELTADNEALLIEQGVIRLVGSTKDVLATRHPDTKIIDLAGRTVLPGMIDAHTHVEFCALSRDWLNIRGAPRSETLARLQRKVAAWQPRSDAIEWLIAQGTYGQDLPNRKELDEVSLDIPILVRESMHRLTANSAALHQAGIVRGRTSPLGARIEVDVDGVPTGLIEEGFHLFPVPPPNELAEKLYFELCDSFLRHGVTTIYELPATAGGISAYQQLHARGRLPARLSLNLTVAPGLNPILSSADQIAEIGLATGFGDDKLWLGGLKVFLDGDDTAAYDSSALNKQPSRWGIRTRLYSEIVQLLVTAYQADLQVWIHAIGDLAQQVALDAIEESTRVTGCEDHRTRIEHVANRWIDSELINRLKDLHVIPVPTAAFIYADNGNGSYAYRTLIDAGLQPPGNSDTGGTQPFATNPWFGVARMLDRRTHTGTTVTVEEAVDVNSAIRTYTNFGAFAGFQQGRIGALGIGMYGDCAVYGDDPRTLPPKTLETLECDLTVVHGKIVWHSAQSDSEVDIT